MTDTKDNFTAQADKYAKYRPTYPAGLYDFIFSLTSQRQAAWDCGTGNGQVAVELARVFDEVYATDISAQQIQYAVQRANIFYSVGPAETTPFADNSFDLVTVAQAIHWFDFDLFYREVSRVMRPGGLLAVIGYGLVQINAAIDPIVDGFYRGVVGPYWDKERSYIDEHYQTIPFPFEEIRAPRFEIAFDWTLNEFTGYLETWSAVQHYIKAKGENPIVAIASQLSDKWPQDGRLTVRFPVLTRLTYVNKPLD